MGLAVFPFPVAALVAFCTEDLGGGIGGVVGEGGGGFYLVDLCAQ